MSSIGRHVLLGTARLELRQACFCESAHDLVLKDIVSQVHKTCTVYCMHVGNKPIGTGTTKFRKLTSSPLQELRAKT
jgi:hypothetical protein